MRTEFPIYSQFQVSAGQLDLSCINVNRAGVDPEKELEECRLKAMKNAFAALDSLEEASISNKERFEVISKDQECFALPEKKGMRLSLKNIRNLTLTTIKSISNYMTL